MRHLFFIAVIMVLTTSCVQITQKPFDMGMRAYQNGDYAETYKYMLTSAQGGYPAAQFNLALMYDKGLGIPQDYAEALKWYCKASVGGEIRGFANIGEMYANGWGVPLDEEKARHWYRMGADLGDALGQLYTVREYAKETKEKGLPKDLDKAYLWLNLVFLQDLSFLGYDREIVLFLSDLEEQMSPQQIKAGKEAVKRWKPAPFDAAMADRVKASEACAHTVKVVE